VSAAHQALAESEETRAKRLQIQSEPSGRGRMIALEDRQALVQNIGVAQSAGAWLSEACEVCGTDRRALH
jgi:hypothetical protein